MLKQRVITALVLLAVLLPALFAPVAWPFALVTLVMIGAAGWEWGRLNGASFAGSLGMGALLSAACGSALWCGWASAAPKAVWWGAALVWVLGGALALKGGPPAWPHLSKPLRWVLGLLALWTAWLALANARTIGVNFILSVFCLVWMADIAAYFSGRAFGRHKLAPAISPGKSWEGVWGGVAGVLVLAGVWIGVEQSRAVDSMSLYTLLLERRGGLTTVSVLLFLAAMSVVGDLMESLVKRSAGVKDSSALLPGHGGVLDRIDALLPVFPLALAMSSL